MSDTDAVARLATVISDSEPMKPLVGDENRRSEKHEDEDVHRGCKPPDRLRRKLKRYSVPGCELVQATEERPPDEHSQRADCQHLNRKPTSEFEIGENSLSRQVIH